jgi:hypothetical protein
MDRVLFPCEECNVPDCIARRSHENPRRLKKTKPSLLSADGELTRQIATNNIATNRMQS